MLAWVLGAGGLLGSHLSRAAERSTRLERWLAEGPLAWSDPSRLDAQLAAAARAFLGHAAAGGHAGWVVFWCAGVGVVGTSARELAGEAAAWELLLSRLACALDESAPAAKRPGIVFLASSAGGVYGGSSERPITERTCPAPVSDYGRAKLRQEEALAAWAKGRGDVSSLVARISNLYGPGQNLRKPQGLVARMSQCLIHRQPVHVYVPMDTTRDYVYAADAAGAIVRWTWRLAGEAAGAGAPLHVTKICASEAGTTVARLIGAFRQTARRQLRVVTGVHAAGSEQPARLQFRSVFWPDEPLPAQTSLPVGIDRLHRYQLALYQAGALPSLAPPTGA